MKLKGLAIICLSPLLFNYPAFAEDKCTKAEIKKSIKEYEQEAIVNCGSQSFKPIIDIINQNDVSLEIRKNAVYFLSQINEDSTILEAVVPPLISIVEDENIHPEVRLETVSTLANIAQKLPSSTVKIVKTLSNIVKKNEEKNQIDYVAFANLEIIANNIANHIINQREEQSFFARLKKLLIEKPIDPTIEESDEELKEIAIALEAALEAEKNRERAFDEVRQRKIQSFARSLNTIEQHQKPDLYLTITNWITRAWLIQIGFWIVLIFVYPKSAQVQAIFFWNPKVRKILGLWYVDMALTWIPFLRRKLFVPFKESLLADAHLDTFNPNAYFADLHVKLGDSTDTKSIREAIPEIKGQIILEGESGLGKSMFLRNLAASSSRITVYLQAQKCAPGVIEAIKDKLHGYVKEDPNFLVSLIYSGAVDICIDGLNEVTPDTRAKIANFVENYTRGNTILATQPLEWTPPSTVKVYDLQPLKQDSIEQFLLSRKAILPTDALVRGSDYDLACQDYLNTVFTQRELEEQQDIRRMLSNPMELTIVALMLSQKKHPNLLNLQQQQYEILAEDYHRLHPSETFPLKAFSETVYQMRLEDRAAIPPEQWLDELRCMERHKMVISRQSSDFKGQPVKEWNFRHDKIQDFFIMQTFLEKQEDKRIVKRIGDPRFRGVYFLLATTMPIDDANKLREHLIQYAADTKNHTVSDTFIQLVRSRQVQSSTV